MYGLAICLWIRGMGMTKAALAHDLANLDTNAHGYSAQDDRDE